MYDFDWGSLNVLDTIRMVEATTVTFTTSKVFTSKCHLINVIIESVTRAQTTINRQVLELYNFYRAFLSLHNMGNWVVG